MNRIATTLLKVMRTEVLLGIGLVLWVFSTEAVGRELCPWTEQERTVLLAEALGQEEARLHEALSACGEEKISRRSIKIAKDALKTLGWTDEELSNRVLNLMLGEDKTIEEREILEEELYTEAPERAKTRAEEIRKTKEEKEARQAAYVRELVEARAKNNYSLLASDALKTHEVYQLGEQSTLRATTAEQALTNRLLMLIIEQNDKVLKHLEKQSKDRLGKSDKAERKTK